MPTNNDTGLLFPDAALRRDRRRNASPIINAEFSYQGFRYIPGTFGHSFAPITPPAFTCERIFSEVEDYCNGVGTSFARYGTDKVPHRFLDDRDAKYVAGLPGVRYVFVEWWRVDGQIGHRLIVIKRKALQA